MNTKNVRIGDVLVEEGYITREQLEDAVLMSKSGTTRKRIGEVLTENGMITEDKLLSALSKRLLVPYVSMDDTPVNIEAVEKIPKAIATKYSLIAVEFENGSLVVLISDPLDFYAIEDVKFIVNMPIEVKICKKDEITKAIGYWYSEIDAKSAALNANETAGSSNALSFEDLNETANDTPVVTLINSTLYKAYVAGASDVHIEPFENQTRVRIRVDGQIVDYLTLSQSLNNSIVARIKILSNLDIAEKRSSQDGHFRAKIHGIELNVRVSTLPTIYGEKIVLRFMNQSAAMDHADTFGMNPDDYLKMMSILQMPNGIVYITGPTGSGKTTTLYMVLEMLAKRLVNISTIEDPVEKYIDRVNQTQINVLAGVTFESGLRSILRQDPDIIMIGETRDNETASISVRAALTGHLVLSTLHTNDAVSAIARLLDMGVEDYLLANSLAGVVAQRLVKKICPHCKESYQPTQAEEAILGLEPSLLYRGKGCHVCNNTGYKGRIAIHEILAVDYNIRNMISRKATAETIYAYVRENNKLNNLRSSLTQLVLSGTTTMEELLKLTYFVE